MAGALFATLRAADVTIEGDHMLSCRHALAAAIVLGVAATVPAKAQQPGCMAEIMPMREALEKQGKALQAAADRKADRSEICSRIRTYAATEAKFVKYLETNQSWCGIPPEAVKQVKANYGNTLKMRSQACAPAAQAPVQRGPGLSEALGTVRRPAPATGASSGVGTYNTLTGNPFNR